MLYSIQDFDSVLETPTGMPIYEIWIQGSQSLAAGTVFMMVLFIAAVMALIACQQTASRLTWALARDDALFGSKFIGRVSARWEVPIWALFVNNFIVFIIGFIYLGSSTAFNAFIGTGLVLGQVTYAFPAALVMFRGRSDKYLPANRPFKLPGVVGWVVNFLTIAFAIVVLVFYDFPVALPVTSSNMNYTSAVIGVMFIFGLLNWFVHARRVYKGPRIHWHDAIRN